MAVNESEIKNLSRLARINIDNQQVPDVCNAVNTVLKLIDQLQQIDTDVEPLFHPLEITQRLREDEVNETNEREMMQSCAPMSEDGLYLVPKVID